MNVFEMLSFDFQEFVTSPAGILIIVGIVFLLVGIVIFLKEGKKAAKQVEEVKEDIKPVEAQPAAQEASAPESTPVEPVQEVAPVIVKATEDGVNEVPVTTVTDTLNIADEKPVVVAPTEEIKAESLDMPVVETVAPVVETVAPVVETTAPVVENAEVAQPTVYGGASPEIKNYAEPERPREIYGGANPLENTAPIPTVAVNTVAPAPVEPVVETPVAPVVETTPVAPVVETVAPAVAPVQSAPVIEPPKEEIEKLEF